MEEGVICNITGEGDREVTRLLAPRSLRSFIMRNYHFSFGHVIEGRTLRTKKFRNVFFLAKNVRRCRQFCLDLQGLPDGEGIKAI